MNTESLQNLFVDELKDIYNAEKQLVRALPRMARAASAPQLRKAFEDHLKQTEGHVARLERIFKELGVPARGKRCKGMEGIIEEGKEVIDEHEGTVLDAGLISAAQRVEHYEIAAYGCVRTYAELLGYTQAAKLLQQTLSEEEATDELLNELAEGGINQAAMSAAGEAMEEE
ncbi:MAG TPA: ferritin-like domain-containing protein [Gemmatimonadales bacterium]|nr:ferritin-like domain-containing protein [Gemmatimonadales bacterium]